MTPARASRPGEEPDPTPVTDGTDGTDHMASWREAWRIRRAHPQWVVLWVAPAGQYRAHRLSRKRRDTILAATTPEDLTAQIEQAEQAAAAGRYSEGGGGS
jgi:hypothetical protein